MPQLLFPCESVWVRLSADKGGVRLLGLDFTGRLDRPTPAAVGETRYVPVGESCPPFAAETPELMRATSGAQLPGGAPYLKLWGESAGTKVEKALILVYSIVFIKIFQTELYLMFCLFQLMVTADSVGSHLTDITA